MPLLPPSHRRQRKAGDRPTGRISSPRLLAKTAKRVSRALQPQLALQLRNLELELELQLPLGQPPPLEPLPPRLQLLPLLLRSAVAPCTRPSAPRLWTWRSASNLAAAAAEALTQSRCTAAARAAAAPTVAASAAPDARAPRASSACAPAAPAPAASTRAGASACATRPCRAQPRARAHPALAAPTVRCASVGVTAARWRGAAPVTLRRASASAATAGLAGGTAARGRVPARGAGTAAAAGAARAWRAPASVARATMGRPASA